MLCVKGLQNLACPLVTICCDRCVKGKQELVLRTCTGSCLWKALHQEPRVSAHLRAGHRRTGRWIGTSCNPSWPESSPR